MVEQSTAAAVGTDIAVLDIADVELAADPAVYVIQACERAKTWLAHALEHGGIEQIVEMKSQAEAIRVYTMSKQLGMDAQLSAAEVVRRAERGIGLAIRKGQSLGEIKRRGQRDTPGNQHTGGIAEQGFNGNTKPSPTDFATADELHGNHAGIYHMTDDVTNEQFEAAVIEGKAENNLSRANLVRKVRAKREATEVRQSVLDEPSELEVPDSSDRTGFANMQRRAALRTLAAEGHTSKQIAEKLGRRDDVVRQMAREMGMEIPADKAIGKSSRRIDPNRVVRETVHALEGLAMGVGLILDDLTGLDPAEAKIWAASLTESTRTLNRLVKAMKEMAQ